MPRQVKTPSVRAPRGVVPGRDSRPSTSWDRAAPSSRAGRLQRDWNPPPLSSIFARPVLRSLAPRAGAPVALTRIHVPWCCPWLSSWRAPARLSTRHSETPRLHCTTSCSTLTLDPRPTKAPLEPHARGAALVHPAPRESCEPDEDCSHIT
jgi:hypothetical protein